MLRYVIARNALRFSYVIQRAMRLGLCNSFVSMRHALEAGRSFVVFVLDMSGLYRLEKRSVFGLSSSSETLGLFLTRL